MAKIIRNRPRRPATTTPRPATKSASTAKNCN